MKLPKGLLEFARDGALTIFVSPSVQPSQLARARGWRVLEHQEPLPDKATLREWLLRGGALFVGYAADEPAFAERFEALSQAWGGRLPKAWVASRPGRIPDVIWQKWVWRGLWMFTASADEVLDALEAG